MPPTTNLPNYSFSHKKKVKQAFYLDRSCINNHLPSSNVINNKHTHKSTQSSQTTTQAEQQNLILYNSPRHTGISSSKLTSTWDFDPATRIRVSTLLSKS